MGDEAVRGDRPQDAAVQAVSDLVASHLEDVEKRPRLDEAACVLEDDAGLVASSGGEDHVRLVVCKDELPKRQPGRERRLAVATGDAEHGAFVNALAVPVQARELLDEAPLPGLKLERLPCGRPLPVDEVSWEEVGGPEPPRRSPPTRFPGRAARTFCSKSRASKRRWRSVSAAW